MLIRDKFFIAGRWTAPSASETIDVHDAGSGEVMGRVPARAAKDIDAAVAAARGALEAWNATPAASRADFLQNISDGLKARADEPAAQGLSRVG